MTLSNAVFSAPLIASALLLAGPPAKATSGGHLVYSAPQACATQAEFVASVADRGGHFDEDAPPATAKASARELHVAISQDSGGFHGSFQTVAADGASATRDVHGATCSEVVAALAVVSAIALRGDDAPSNAAAAPVVPAVAPSATPDASESAVEEGRFRASSGVGAKKIEVSAGTVRFDLARSLSAFAGGELGVLRSTVLPRYDLSFSGANFVTLPGGKSYLTGVIPRLRVSYLGQATYHAQDASVSAQGVAVGLGLCWSPLYDTRGLVALLCAEYGLGVMQLKSRDAAGQETQSKSPALQTGGFGLEMHYNLGSLFHIGLKAGVDAMLQPISADRPDGTEIFHSSTFAGYGMLGFGFQF